MNYVTEKTLFLVFNIRILFILVVNIDNIKIIIIEIKFFFKIREPI